MESIEKLEKRVRTVTSFLYAQRVPPIIFVLGNIIILPLHFLHRMIPPLSVLILNIPSVLLFFCIITILFIDLAARLSVRFSATLTSC